MRFLIAVLALSLAVAPLRGQASAEQLARCAVIAVDADRLQCFDALAKSAPELGNGGRYIVPSRIMGIETTAYPLWSTAEFASSCARAVISGTKEDQRQFCDSGFAGLKPKLGTLTVGIQVEVLDAQKCRNMVSVRVLTGPVRGETGCIAASALSRVKPQ